MESHIFLNVMVVKRSHEVEMRSSLVNDFRVNNSTKILRVTNSEKSNSQYLMETAFIPVKKRDFSHYSSYVVFAVDSFIS